MTVMRMEGRHTVNKQHCHRREDSIHRKRKKTVSHLFSLCVLVVQAEQSRQPWMVAGLRAMVGVADYCVRKTVKERKNNREK